MTIHSPHRRSRDHKHGFLTKKLIFQPWMKQSCDHGESQFVMNLNKHQPSYSLVTLTIQWVHAIRDTRKTASLVHAGKAQKMLLVILIVYCIIYSSLTFRWCYKATCTLHKAGKCPVTYPSLWWDVLVVFCLTWTNNFDSKLCTTLLMSSLSPAITGSFFSSPCPLSVDLLSRVLCLEQMIRLYEIVFLLCFQHSSIYGHSPHHPKPFSHVLLLFFKKSLISSFIRVRISTLK